MRPQIRMGLNTGAAVVAKAEDGDDAGDAVLGVTVNFLRPVLAEPDAVFMSEAVHPAWCWGWWTQALRASTRSRGKSLPQRAYRLESSSAEPLRSGCPKEEKR